MTRKTTPGKRIALLATGDEITSGDILNTNARDIARRLSDHSIQTGMQMAVSDHIDEIEQAIHHLLASHDGLIMTGGLGPTSDDLTRFALAKALNQPLVFETRVWESIAARLRQFGYPNPPESNRQQALFPKEAEIIQNDAGTAAGCRVMHGNKPIFMLPGPPAECMPMVDRMILPTLKSAGFCEPVFRKHWMLFGVSEGQIAETLDKIAFDGHCMTGYRLCYPYVEFKLYSESRDHFMPVADTLQAFLSKYLIGNGHQTASEWFMELFIASDKHLAIRDEATGGLLEATLMTPKTHPCLHFTVSDTAADIHIWGLSDYWQEKNVTRTALHLAFPGSPRHPEQSIEAPFRDARVKQFAVEWICRELGRWLQDLSG